MPVIQDRLAGRGQILLGDLVNPPAPALDETAVEQLGQMLGRVVVAATSHLGQFGNRARLATGQFLEHFPSPPVRQRFDQPVNVWQGRNSGIFWGFQGWIHEKQRILP